MTRTPKEMLELLVNSIKLSTEEATKIANPLAMIYHYDSVIVSEARRVLEETAS